jgi:hypothetical protein
MAIRPGRHCTICGHRNRPAIDQALLTGRSQSSIASEFTLSRDALSRHYLRHVSVEAADGSAPPASETADGPVDLVGSVASLQARVMALLKKAERDRDLRGALAAVREAAGLLMLLGKMTGVIAPDGTRVQINLGGGSANIKARILQKLAALAGPEPAPTTITIEHEGT